MERASRIYVAGHRGLAGSAIVRRLGEDGYTNVVIRAHGDLDLTRQQAVEEFFSKEKPEYVFLAAAKVGGILANDTYPAEFLRENLAIQGNVIHESWRAGVKRLLFLGSSCIYPRDCPQPIKEEYLLTGELEATNRSYAIAKIAGIEMCRAYNRQYGARFLAAMPTNLFGPEDNYDLHGSHVIPALIRKFHTARARGDSEVIVWGTGKPKREFLYSDDLADACVFLMTLPEDRFENLPGLRASAAGKTRAPLINVGAGKDTTIAELAETIKAVVGFEGNIVFDHSKPDGTPRKLLDVSLMAQLGWRYRTDIRRGLDLTYRDLLDRAIPATWLGASA